MSKERKQSQTEHWGRWAWARAGAMGYRRQADLAEAVGCSPQQLCKWLAMARPPKIMRKGFDGALARALKADRETVFSGYGRVAAESGVGDALEQGQSGRGTGTGTIETADEEKLRHVLAALASILCASELRELCSRAVSLAADRFK